MQNEIKCIIKLRIPAGQASASPPTGPILGQYGLNIMDFCKNFNERTQDFKSILLPVLIVVFDNNTFIYTTKIPPISYFLKNLLNIEKGSSEHAKDLVGVISVQQLYELSVMKSKQFPYEIDVQHICNMLHGTCDSMCITVSDLRTKLA